MTAMDLSYAQRLEDYHLACAFEGEGPGFYVDVGGGHPVADNVSYWFYLQGWRGLVAEPQEPLFARYRSLRPRDTVLCTLVGRRSGETDFHVVERFHGLSTMVEHHARQAESFGAAYATVRRPVATLAQLCEAHGVGRIDFLKVDVEGAEADVFAGADWARWRPRVIVAEAIAPNAPDEAWREWEGGLLAQDYRFALFDGLNRFYVAAEETGLLARMPREPAPWGVVRHLYEFGRAPENPLHPDHALTGRLVAGLKAGRCGEESLDAFLAGLPMRPDAELRALLGADDAVGSEPFRAALGRIAAPYDGGLMLDDEPAAG
ncbi:MAG TPA: FkbM family methyltransferase [Microvirga sp.]|nr:FkbM family methyltransferase [Microvirga sp.]